MKKNCVAVLSLCLLFLSFGMLSSCNGKQGNETVGAEVLSAYEGRQTDGTSVLALPARKKSGKNVSSGTVIAPLDGDFEVLYVTPSETISSAVRYPTIQVQFSHPVVALEKLGDAATESDLVTIEPHLDGTFKWYGTSLLSFVSTSAVEPQTVYNIKINKDAVDISGKKIKGDLNYSFRTAPLNVVSFLPGYEEQSKGNSVDVSSVPLSLSSDIALYFSSPIDAEYIKSFVSVTYDGVSKSFTAKQLGSTGIRLTVSESPAEEVEVCVTIKKGAAPKKGAVTTTHDMVYSFTSLRKFRIDSTDNSPYWYSERYSNPVEITFSGALKLGDEAEIAKNITTDLGTPVTADNIVIYDDSLIIHGLPVKFSSSYKLTVKKELRDFYGRTLDKDYDFYIDVPEARSFVNFKAAWKSFPMLESQFSPKIAFMFQNIVNDDDDKSVYRIKPISGVPGLEAPSETQVVYYDADDYERNTKILQAADLTPALVKTSSGEYRGAALFTAKFYTTYKYSKYNSSTSMYEPAYRNTYSDTAFIVQVTDLGLTVRYGYNKAAVLVTSLKTGQPVRNALVNVYDARSYNGTPAVSDTSYLRKLGSAYSDENGMAMVDIIKEGNYASSIYVEALVDEDRAIFDPDINSNYFAGVVSSGYPSRAGNDEMVAFMFTDRGLYKPGETITFRIIDRDLCHDSSYGKDGYSVPAREFYTIDLASASWNEDVYMSSEGWLSENGTAWGKFTIPEDFTPGTYSLKYHRGQKTATINIQIQYFEKLRFEVKSSVPEVEYYSGDTVTAQFAAQYLGGGSMGNCSYYSYWTREAVGYKPQGNAFAAMRFGPLNAYDGRTSLGSSNGMLDADGKVSLNQKTGDEKVKGMAYSYRVETQVTDSGNQQIGSVARAMVHPAYYYIGVAKVDSKSGFPKKGETLKMKYVCVRPDGSAPIASDLPPKADRKLKIELLREEWKQVQQRAWNGQINTRYEYEMVTESEEVVDLSGTSSETEFTIVPPKGGYYILRLSSIDSKGRDVVTERSFYVTSSDWYWFSRDNASEISLHTDKDTYEVGDTASILMQSPLPKGRYLITQEREGLIKAEVREINEPTSVLEVKIEDSFVPIMYVTVSSYSVRNGMPQNDFETPDIDKPKGYFGVAALNVNPTTKTFDIEVIQNKPSYRPGEEATVTVRAKQNGNPVSGAEITLMAVDRGVIDLIDYHVSDPVKYFYNANRFPLLVRGGDSRSMLLDPVTYEIRNLIGGDSDGDKFGERKNFDPTAVFVPDLITNSKGEATCSFKLPDSLTAYRITAVGVKQNDFALHESEMNVANPVSVRTVLPRALRFDDVCEFGVTASNLDASAHDVTISVAVYEGIEKTSLAQAEGGLIKLPGKAAIEGDSTRQVTIKGQQTLPIMFLIDAITPGWVTIEYTVTSDVVNEKIYMPLEIERPYIYEVVTATGTVSSGGKNKVASGKEMICIPSDIDSGMGELYIQLDPTKLGMLHEAVNYVFHYPYGCMEQRSSAMLPLVAFGKYIDIFDLKGEVKDYREVVEAEFAYWSKYQNADGGFPYWPRNEGSNTYVSARIAEICAYAEKDGIDLGGINTNDLAKFLEKSAERIIDKELEVKEENRYYSGYGSWSTAAYALYGAGCLGRKVNTGLVNKVYNNTKDFTRTKLLCGLIYLSNGDKKNAKKVLDEVKNRTTVTTRGIQFNDNSPYYWYESSSDIFALFLQLLTQVDTHNTLNQNTVYELLLIQKATRGYWGSTSAASRVFVAINEYIRTNNLEKLDFTAQALISGKTALEGSFTGVGAQPVETRESFVGDLLANLPRDKNIPVEFRKEGEGDLFYTLLMKYAVPPYDQEAKEQGFTVYTEIFDTQTGERVTDDVLEVGKVYKQVVHVSTTLSREFVALRVPVPAGCEIVNALFATKDADINNNGGGDSYYASDYYYYYDDRDYWDYSYDPSHQAIYNTEVQYFWNTFYRGYDTVEFTFRATRRGIYNTPSVQAECMYQEEIFGRSAGKVWTID